MKFDLKPQDKSFLNLAERVGSGRASEEDRIALKAMIKDYPDLAAEFVQLQRTFRDEMAAEFWAVAVRVMVGTASPEEVRRIEALRQTGGQEWEKYQEAVDFIEALASRRDRLKEPRIEPMPTHIRKKLLQHLDVQRPKAK